MYEKCMQFPFLDFVLRDIGFQCVCIQRHSIEIESFLRDLYNHGTVSSGPNFAIQDSGIK